MSSVDKDAGVITTTVPDYHDGLREKAPESDHNSRPNEASGSKKNVFDVRPYQQCSVLESAL
jgi:hypothetical protein